VPIILPHSDICTNVFCDPIIGIVSSPVECRPTNCSCDPQLGCQCILGVPRVTDSPPSVAAIGLGAGVISAIVVGSVAFAAIAFFGGKKGLNKLRKDNTQNAAVGENPLYESAQTEQYNPFYVSKA